MNHHPIRTILTRLVMAIILAAAMLAGAYVLTFRHLIARAVPTTPRAIPADHAVADTRPLVVTVTRNWKQVEVECSADELTASPAIWMDMHFGDWDRLPADVRRRGLLRLRHRYGSAVAGPHEWSVMPASEWDAVPQPIRMVVFPLMIEHWVRDYALGSAFLLPSRLISDTVSAIVMAESWFQHRADVVNEWGNRDVGLGQCSNRCRRDLARLADAGLIGFTLSDEDYLNPWHATRAAVVWFGLELARAGGDVDLAVRAYHRGFKAAARGEGAEYLDNVRRLRARYFGPTRGRSPTWQRLATWGRTMFDERQVAPVLPVAASATRANSEPAGEDSGIDVERQLASDTASVPDGEPDEHSSPSGPARGRSR